MERDVQNRGIRYGLKKIVYAVLKTIVSRGNGNRNRRAHKTARMPRYFGDVGTGKLETFIDVDLNSIIGRIGRTDPAAEVLEGRFPAAAADRGQRRGDHHAQVGAL